MTNRIDGIINDYYEGKAKLNASWDPDFHSRGKFPGGERETFIHHRVHGHPDVELVFAEREVTNPSVLVDGYTEWNDYEDRFNYDQVVGYRVNGGAIIWI